MFVQGTNKSEILNGTKNADEIWARGGHDKVNGGDGNDRLGGGTGNDTISGGAGDDQIYGGSGNDVLYGGTGMNTVFSGLGSDTFWIKGSGSYGGGAGSDKFNVNLADMNPKETVYVYGGANDAGSKDALDFDNVKQSDFTIAKAGGNNDYLLIHKETGQKIYAYNIENLSFDGKAYVGTGDPGYPNPKTIEEKFYDRYVVQDKLYTQNGPVHEPTNKLGIDIALDYYKYLLGGGQAFDMLAKDTPTREQTLHDNFLGNLTEDALNWRGLMQYAQDKATQLGIDISDIIKRPYYSGNDGDEQAELNSVAWDFDHNINRDDYNDFTVTTLDTSLSANETDVGGDMFVGSGIPTDDFKVVDFNAAGISISLKVDKYGDTYDNHVSGDVYSVEDGMSSLNANRVDWSAYVSVEEGQNGSTKTVGDATVKGDYDVAIYMDFDPTEAEDFQFVYNLEEIPDSVTSNGDVFQNSFNAAFGFLRNKFPADYADDFVGAADLGIEIRLTDTATGDVVAKNDIDVLVFV